MSSSRGLSHKEIDEILAPYTPERRAAIAKANHERDLRIEMKPMPVTECLTCSAVNIMWTDHCTSCGQQVYVVHVLMNISGQILQPGIDFMWLKDKPV